MPRLLKDSAAEADVLTNPNSTFIDLFLSGMAAGDPERPLIFFEGQAWSYRGLGRMAVVVADQLAECGLAKGDRIVTVVHSTPELVAIQLAIAMIGASFVPLIPQSSGHEFEYSLSHCRPSALIADEGSWPSLQQAARHAAHVFLIGGAEAGQNRGVAPLTVEAGSRDIQRSTVRCLPQDELTVMYTSGSSGRPKGVVLAHPSGVAVGMLAARRLALSPDDVILGVLPLHHFGGLKMLSLALACGGALMMQTRFSRTRFWRDVAFARATAGILMPAMMSILLTEDPAPSDGDHTLRTVISHVVNRDFERRFGVEVITTWGQSELAGTGTLMKPGETDKPAACVGTPVDPQIAIEVRDEEGQRQPTGRVGEIYCRHPWVMRGYLDDVVETQRTLTDGWIATGDRGHLDGQGRLFYDGRRKNMIKRSGENIAGAEVEAMLESHPAVAECVAFGVPDPVRTEELKVVVQLRPGRKVSEAELAAWCAERLAAFKVPRFISIQETIPRLTTMKPDRVQLAREHDPSRTWDRERMA